MNPQIEYRVIVSESAAQMLVNHAAFLSQVSPAAAEKLVSSFETVTNSLAEMPQRCPWLVADEMPRYTYRFIRLEKRYMLLFQIIEDCVYVDYVIDCRQDYKWLL
jgi:plasmid stabilization system protein ParE